MDATGASWLPTLLGAGREHAAYEAVGGPPVLVKGHGATWGDKELSLPAPLALLEHLVLTITPAQVNSSGDSGDVFASRLRLANRDLETVASAMKGLRAGSRSRQWYVLEGPSRPDATLEMPAEVLVIEGKRTERGCTSKTKWMGSRSQLVRHMDAAMAFYPSKRVLGLLLVEGEGGAEAQRPSEYWVREADAQREPSMLLSSLPHRSPGERAVIASGIIGVATWQYVCAAHGLPWPPVPDAP